jgi:hypothetical protein
VPKNSVFRIALIVTFIALNATIADSTPKGKASSKSRLEELEYPQARKKILGFGWTAFKGGCLDNEGPEVCGQFPELINCTQGQPEFCILRFAKPGRWLEIITRGGYLEDNAGTVVDQVGFQNKPCKKTF